MQTVHTLCLHLSKFHLKSGIKIGLVFIFCLSSSVAFSANSIILLHSGNDDTIVYDGNQFFVSLEGNIHEDTVAAFLEDLNAQEIWRSGHLNMALWSVINFPFITGDGETILNIHGAIARSKKKTKIHNASLNIQHSIISEPGFASTTCFDISEFSVAHGDSSTIKISILDTGISDISDNSTGLYNYGLVNYTGYDYVHNDAVPNDENGHGSHIAGIIHSITHFSNPTQSSIEYDIRKTHDSEGKAFLATIVFALLDALDADADIINMSFGYSNMYDDSLFFPLKVAIEEAEHRDALVIAAGGNSGLDNDYLDSVALPASFPTDNILSVASLDCNNQLSSFTNYGARNVDIGVMGENIPGPDLNSGQVNVSGTSQAAAIITAVAALKATYIIDFSPNKVICPLIRSARHAHHFSDRIVSNGQLDFINFMGMSDSTCLMTNFDCGKSFTGPHTLTGQTGQQTMIETGLQIHSSQILEQEAVITFDAAGSTTLMDGFEVQMGASFQIVSDGCNH